MYFPSWVYDQHSAGKDMEMNDAKEEEKKIIKKMIYSRLMVYTNEAEWSFVVNEQSQRDD